MSDLIELESLTPAEVFKEGGADPIVEQIKREVTAVDRDISTPEGRKNVAALAYKVARSKTFIDDMGKTLASDLKKQAKVIDTERGRIWDALELLQKEVRKPLTDFEETEKGRITDHGQRLAAIEALGSFDGLTPSTADLQARLDSLPTLIQRDWEEFGQRATEVSDRITDILRNALAASQKRDAADAELERLRKVEADRIQKERDDRIAAEAAETARKAAEAKAAQDAKALADKAEADRLAAVKAAADAQQAIADAGERERKALADKKAAEEKAIADAKAAEEKAGADAKAAQEKAARDQEAAVQAERDRAEKQRRDEAVAAIQREADTKHKTDINNAALKAFVIIGLSEEYAKLAVEGIAKKQIPAVTIAY